MYRIPGTWQIGRILRGPDRALWFIGDDGGQIGRITTAGAITQFPLSKADRPDIAAGPDQAMWFTEAQCTSEDADIDVECSDAKIGRIPTAAAPRVSFTLSPKAKCTSSTIKIELGVKGGAKLSRADISFGDRRLVRSRSRTVEARLPVAKLSPGSYTVKAVIVDTAGVRTRITRTFQRC